MTRLPPLACPSRGHVWKPDHNLTTMHLSSFGCFREVEQPAFVDPPPNLLPPGQAMVESFSSNPYANHDVFEIRLHRSTTVSAASLSRSTTRERSSHSKPFVRRRHTGCAGRATRINRLCRTRTRGESCDQILPRRVVFRRD